MILCIYNNNIYPFEGSLDVIYDYGWELLTKSELMLRNWLLKRMDLYLLMIVFLYIIFRISLIRNGSVVKYIIKVHLGVLKFRVPYAATNLMEME